MHHYQHNQHYAIAYPQKSFIQQPFVAYFTDKINSHKAQHSTKVIAKQIRQPVIIQAGTEHIDAAKQQQHGHKSKNSLTGIIP